MSAWEKIKVLQRLEGCTKCTSWKHGQGNFKHKRARQNKSKWKARSVTRLVRNLVGVISRVAQEGARTVSNK